MGSTLEGEVDLDLQPSGIRPGQPQLTSVLLGDGTDQRQAQSGTPHCLLPVGYTDVPSFSFASGGTVQTTGAGKVLGLPDGYLKAFPAELRALIGSASGALLNQQTAANLHARVGDRITVARIGLPAADSLFQAVGAPLGTSPLAPPDNVLLLPGRGGWPSSCPSRSCGPTPCASSCTSSWPPPCQATPARPT